MVRRLAVAALLLTVAAPVAATVTGAEICAKAGTAEQWDVGGGFTVLPKSGDRLYVMQLLGESAAPRHEVSGVAMEVDGIFYQFVFVPIADFSALPRKDDAALLAEHAEWEIAAARKLGAPLDKFEDLGNKQRLASDNLEAATFKLWSVHDAGYTAAQYYVTTVVGDEIVVMSAIFPGDPVKAHQFGKVFRNYAETLNWITCPTEAP